MKRENDGEKDRNPGESGVSEDRRVVYASRHGDSFEKSRILGESRRKGRFREVGRSRSPPSAVLAFAF